MADTNKIGKKSDIGLLQVSLRRLSGNHYPVKAKNVGSKS